MKLRLIFITLSSGLLLPIIVIFGMPGILSAAEVVKSQNLSSHRNVAGDTVLAIPQAMTAPTSVSLIPEKLGVVGHSYIFAATVVPTDTTQPISYTWEATGQAPVIHSGGLTDTITFTWFVSGTQVVTVTATNDWGTTTDSYSIFVSDLPALDAAVAFDVSGSMDYETNCFGCWTKDPSADIIENPFPNNGVFNPLRYGANKPFWGGNDPSDLSTAGDAVCGQPVGYATGPGGGEYSVHEAELYSNMGIGNISDTRSWRFEAHAPGQGFWVLQRPEAGVSSNNAFMRPHSFVTYGLPVGSDNARLQGGTYNSDCWNSVNGCWGTPDAPNSPPFLDYDFTVDWGNTDSSHVWIRAIAGSERSQQWKGDPRESDAEWRNALYGRVIDSSGVEGNLFGGPLNGLLNQRDTNIRFLEAGPPYNDEDLWRWVKINNTVLNLANGQYTLRIYQGSSAFNLDKIIITNDPTGLFGVGQQNFLIGGVEGPAATPGSATREACNMCNPSYGQTISDGNAQCSCNLSSADHVDNPYKNDLFPGQAEGSAFNCTRVTEPIDMLVDDLFRDRDPIRSAQEAVKNFARQLDPKIDQLGIVAFNQDVTGKVKLQCKQMWGSACFADIDPISYTAVIEAVEDFTPSGLTDIGEGMREGLEELGLTVDSGTLIGHDCTSADTQACDRQGAAQRILILINDGAPNEFESGDCTNPSEKITWRGLVGTDTDPYNCAMYFAREAAKHNVAVYTIGIGPGADHFLLTAMAKGNVPLPDPNQPCDEATNSNGHACDDPDGAFYFEPHCGQYFSAPRPSDLDAIFDQILALARSCAQPAVGPSLATISAQNPTLTQSEKLNVVLTGYDNTKIYDIFLELGGILYKICSNVSITGDPTIVSCGPLTSVLIGPDFTSFVSVPVGNGYTLFSVETGLLGGPSKVTAPDLVDVVPVDQPLIAVDGKFPPNTTIWAAGDIMPVRLFFHDDVTYDYDVKLFNPDKSSEWNIALNHSGSSADVINWVVPNVGDGVCGATDAADCIINSFVTNTSTPVATTTVRINFPQIILSTPSNGSTYQRGEAVEIFLLAHTPFRNYNMQIPTGTPIGLTSLDTDANGDTFPYSLTWIIPDDCGAAGFPNGTYQMSSHSTHNSNPGALIALSEEFEVFTPSSPGLTVNGGTTWPAGSIITIRVLRHLTETTHYLKFDSVRIPTGAVDNTFITDSCGQAEIAYAIPTSTVPGTYVIASFENTNQVQQATVEVEVTNAGDPDMDRVYYLPVIMKQ